MEFFLVYIREAHPDIKQGGKEIGKAENLEKRALLASKCVSELNLTMPALIDDMEGTVERVYRGWPDRMCIVDLDGKVAYYGKRGPFGFKPDEAEEALKVLLSQSGRVTGEVVAEKTKDGLESKKDKEPKWSRMVRGLRGCATVSSHSLSVRDKFIVDIKIQNLGYDSVYLYYMDVYEAGILDIRDENGEPIKAERRVMYKLLPEDGRSFHLIKPGEIFEKQLKGRLVRKVSVGGTTGAAREKQLILEFDDIEYRLADRSKFTVGIVFEADGQTAVLGEKVGKKPVWMGDLRLEMGPLEIKEGKKWWFFWRKE